MVLLSDAGWSAPRIVRHLGGCGQTVRDLLRVFLARGLEALYPFRSGPDPSRDNLDRVAGELRCLLADDRTWTSRQPHDDSGRTVLEIRHVGTSVKNWVEQISASLATTAGFDRLASFRAYDASAARRGATSSWNWCEESA